LYLVTDVLQEHAASLVSHLDLILQS